MCVEADSFRETWVLRIHRNRARKSAAWGVAQTIQDVTFPALFHFELALGGGLILRYAVVLVGSLLLLIAGMYLGLKEDVTEEITSVTQVRSLAWDYNSPGFLEKEATKEYETQLRQIHKYLLSFPSPTPAPVRSPVPIPVPPIPAQHQLSSGYYVTYYGSCCEGEPFYCGTEIYGFFSSSDPTVVATGDSGLPCGTHMTICSDAVCINAIVKDRCGSCDPYHLDLSYAGWIILGQPVNVEVYL